MDENQGSDTGREILDSSVESYKDVFDDTLYFVDAITSEYEFYPSVLSMLRNADISLAMKKRHTLRAIDDLWIKTIEESLPALDAVIRNPNRFIEEVEKVLPIEFSHNISSRSIKHLAQHTDLISRVEGDTIVPSKILNVFHEETIQTYENKFINTLIDRLFLFVARRYDAIMGKDQVNDFSELEFSGDFVHGDVKGKIHFGIEVTEQGKDAVTTNGVIAGDDLLERIKRIYEITRSYTASEFVKTMDKAYIKPPVMRTNAIMKNKDMRQCLALWQFIEGFEGTGFQVSVSENVEKIDNDYVNELYASLALQYMIFRYKTGSGFSKEDELAFAETKEPLKPRFVNELTPFDSRMYDIAEKRYVRRAGGKAEKGRASMDEIRKMTREIDTVLAADRILEAKKKEEAKRIAAEKAAEELAQKRAAEAAEKERIREEKRKKTRALTRKEKKSIRRKAEVKAEKEGVELPKVFDYDEFMRYLNGEGQNQDNK